MRLLEVRNIKLEFGGIRALCGVSFEVGRHELVSLIGPNGAGKTTVFNCVNGIYRPTGGDIRYKDRSLIGLEPDAVARAGIARTFQNIELFSNMSTLDNLLLGRHLHIRTGLLGAFLFTRGVREEEVRHRRAVEEVMDLLDLQHARDQLVGGLPYGTQKLVELGRALAMEPEVLLLDEPTAGMNAEEKLDFTFRLADVRAGFDLTILLIEHDMQMVMHLSDRVLAMNEGCVIVCGDPETVQAHPEVHRAYLGTPPGDKTGEEPT